jgi:predicted nucleic acid-binding protein
MIVLDTNVISALMREPAQPAVLHWLDEQPAESIWTTTITIFEVRFGLALLPLGKRRKALESAFDALVGEDLQNRVLEFDSAAAVAAASLGALRRSAGRPLEMRDLQIAGIALARRGTLATRNVRHFEGTGVPLINPWPV